MKVTLQSRKQNEYSPWQGLQFSRVDKSSNKQIDSPEQCKELFAERFCDWKTNKSFRILFSNCRKAERGTLKAENVQDLLNQVETKMGFAKSKVWDVTEDESPGQLLLVESTNRWATKSPLLHFYLLLVRNGSGHSIGKTWQQTLAKFRRSSTPKAGDKVQFVAARDAIQHIVEDRGKLVKLTGDPHSENRSMDFMYNIGICTYAYKRQQLLANQQFLGG